MAYFEDGSPFSYDRRPSDGSLNAGWIGGGRPYRRGIIPLDAIHRLAALCGMWNFSERERLDALIGSHLGYHVCSLCPLSLGDDPWHLLIEGESHLLGSRVLRIPANGCEYRVPNLMLHYILDHFYLPPKPLVDALQGRHETVEGRDWFLEFRRETRLRRSICDYPKIDEISQHAVRSCLIRGERQAAIQEYQSIQRVDFETAAGKVDAIAAGLRERRRIEVAEIIRSHGGLSKDSCAWQGCDNRCLESMAICVEHAFPWR